MTISHTFRPTYVDIFCGAGLFSEGLRLAGLTPVYAADIDENAVESYQRNVSGVAEITDVRQLPQGMKADVLIAGPPCQGFSTLGRRDPADARNPLSLLVPEWADMLDAQIAVVENVPKFLETDTARNLIRKFVTKGYRVTSLLLDAADFGLAQHRLRAFVIATKSDTEISLTPRKRKQLSFREAVLDRPIPTNDPMHCWPQPSQLALSRFKLIPACGDKRDLLFKHPNMCPPSWAALGNQATGVWGRINAESPTNTIRCTFQNPSKGRYIHPTENRVLSLREAARLQGIPDSWELCGSPSSIARQIGNGVPVKVAWRIGKKILKLLSSR